MTTPRNTLFTWLGDDAEGEGGMLSLVSLFVVLGFLALFAVLANTGKTVSQKLELQNAADSAAYAAGVVMARGMNTTCAANHLIGELQALTVLHHGLGGDPIDGRGNARRTPRDIQDSLRISYDIARLYTTGSWQPYSYQYDAVKKEPATEAAIRDARLRLKQVMTWAYVGHAVGGIFTQLRWIPYVGPILQAIGYTIIGLCMVFEFKVYAEWLVLDGLEMMARVLAPIKRDMLQTAAIPAIYWYTRALKYGIALKAEEAAQEVGKKNKVEVSLFPGLRIAESFPPLKLRFAPEPTNLKHLDRSQLVRASTPWVQYWRIPILKWAEKALLLSRFKCYYQNRTDEYTLTLAKRMKTEKGVNPVILKDLELDGRDKTFELWTYAGNGSIEADKIFCVIGFAHRKKPPLAAAWMFRQGNPDGMAAYAQVMFYNGNPQRRGKMAGWQATAGWDTLNWGNSVPEVTTCDPNTGTCPVPTIAEPKIRLNWRAKLVPTTRLAESIWWQKDDLGKILRRTPPQHTPLSGTH